MNTILIIVTLFFGTVTHSAGDARSDAALMLDYVRQEPTIIYDFTDGVVCDVVGLPNTCSFGDDVRDLLTR